MHILFLTDRYPPYILGGYEIACHAIAGGLRERGHDVTVLTSNFGLNGAPEPEGHVERLLHRPQDSPKLLELARWELADNETLRRLVDRRRPDVIYAWSMLQLFSSLYATLHKSNVPLVFNIQDLWIPAHLAEGEIQRMAWVKSGSNPAKALAKRAFRSVYKWRHPSWLRPTTLKDVDLSHVVFCSEFQKKQHINAGLPLGDSRVIYNGIDLSIFNGRPSSNGKDRLRALFVGRLVKEKGAHTAIEAIHNLVQRGHDVSLSIAGVPAYPLEYAASLRETVKARHLQDHVRFLGAVPNHDLPDVYRQHDVLVFPSNHNEGLPMTLLEGMACGIAVVGATTGGSIEMLDDGVNSLTFPPDDPVALKDRLDQLIASPTLMRSLASAGQTLVREKFGLERITDQTIEYLEGVAKT